MATIQPMAPAAAGQPSPAPQGAPQGAPAGPVASPSIYVGDLDPKVTEAMLYEHFRSIGPVVSVRVCIDSQTHKSLGYGYVNFQSPQDAERAIETLNGSRLADRPCRVAKIQRDPTQRKSGITNIVVKGLSPEMDGALLKDLFGKFGRISSIKVPTNEGGQPRGYAYVMFEKEEAAKLAVDEMHDAEVTEGVKITVERYKNPAAVREEAMKKFTNLYVKNLAPNIDDKSLAEAFAKYGEITSSKVRIDETGKAMGFGFVAFADHDAAVLAIDELNEQPSQLAADGGILSVKRFMDKKERLRAREAAYRERQANYAKYPNLYVKNFDDTVTEQQLKDVFEQFGPTVSVKVQYDPFTKVSRGFGFVSFKDHASAQKAVTELAGSRALGMRPLFVTYALRRDARRQQFEDMQKKRGTRMGMGGMGAMGMAGPMAGPMGGYNAGPMGPQQMMFQQGPNPNMQPAYGRMMPGQPMPGPGQMMQRPMQGPNPGMMMGQPMNPMMMGAMPRGPGPMAPRPMVPQKTMPPMPGMPAPHPSGLDAQYLASMTPEQQKNVLGERLYTYIVKKYPKQAAKITGMLLEMDNSEILNLLDSPQLLDGKINEALEVLERHDQTRM